MKSSDIHAGIMGSLRRAITLFLWPAVLGLQPICVAVAEAMQLNITTKLHRLMYHTGDHLRSFRCTRRGDSDEKETLHRSTKARYDATNRRLHQIASKLIAVRSIADATASFLNLFDINADALVTATLITYEQLLPNLTMFLSSLSDVLSNVSNDYANPAALAITRTGTLRPRWKLANQVRFFLTFEWDPRYVL
eukprot:IDg6956t1